MGIVDRMLQLTLPEKYPDFIDTAMDFPPFYPVRQRPPGNGIKDAALLVYNSVEAAIDVSGIGKGDSVGLCIGSRGIAQLPQMVRAACESLRRAGAEPVLIPAMGSHGGASGEGQAVVLEKLGITEQSVGSPVRSSVEVERLGTAFGEVPVYFSRDVLKLKHCICLNRIKPHTKFRGSLESGIHKMLAVGLGKHVGASVFHKWVLKYGFQDLLREFGRVILENTNFRFGIAVVENSRDEPMAVETLFPQSLEENEARLLALAREHMPSLPVREADVLIIGEIGKAVSGAGMDPNITGRARDLGEADFSESFKAGRIALLDLCRDSDGNAVGFGNADFVTAGLLSRMDYGKTVINALTGISVYKGSIPVCLPNDRMAIQACFATLGPIPPARIRAILIRNTLCLDECWVSEALVGEVLAGRRTEVGEPFHIEFDRSGCLIRPRMVP